MNKKIPTPLVILIILLVITAIIGIALWFCPEKEAVLPQDETADWQTYRSDKYGFEVKYSPEIYGDFWTTGSGWWLGIPDLFSVSFWYRPPEFTSDNGICTYNISITVADNQQILSNQDWLQKYGEYVGYIKNTTEEPKEININNLNGLKLENLGGLPPSGGNIDGLVIVSKNSRVYLISLNIEQETFPTGNQTFESECSEKGIAMFNKMLSTFKFADFSILDKDELLHKLFPNLTFTDGIANHTAEHYEFLNLHLQDSIEDYFIDTQEKNLLLVVKLDGVAHAGGLYHAYLGLFDKNGDLLTPTSSYPIPNHPNPYGEDYYDFNLDKAQFGGDQGDFGFYDCKGLKYIAFAWAGCPNGSCCSGGVDLFRINNGEFEKLQTIYGDKMILSDEKIIVKTVPLTSDNGCPETDGGEFNWNKENCRFE